MIARQRTGAILACLWAIFVIRGLFSISVLPLWEGFDEWAHYAVIQEVAGGHLLSQRDGRVSKEVEASLRLAPWRPGERDSRQQHAAYWQLPDAARDQRRQAIRSIPQSWASEAAPNGPRSYEAQQAPVYYWLLAPLYRLTEVLPLLSRVWFLRLASLLIASALVPFGFLAAREAFQSDGKALGLVITVIAMPQLMMTVGRIANDSLAVPLGALLVFLLLRSLRQPPSFARSIVLGVTLGVTLLTKAYFLALVPPALGCLFPGRRTRVAWRHAAIVFVLAALIAGWWYARNWQLTQSLSGEQLEVVGPRSGVPLLQAIATVAWTRAIDFVLVSQIWLGNWSFLVVRSWMYHCFYVLLAGASIGLVIRFVKPGSDLPDGRQLLLLMATSLTFRAALAYHVVRSFQSQGISATFGYYAFAIVFAEAILLCTGGEALAPARAKWVVMPLATICFSALDFFGTQFYLLPYYTGFATWLPNGSMHAMQLSKLQGHGFALMISRLAFNKPTFLGTSVLVALWGLSIAALIGLILLSVALGYRMSGRPSGPARQTRHKSAAAG